MCEGKLTDPELTIKDEELIQECLLRLSFFTQAHREQPTEGRGPLTEFFSNA